MKIFGNISKAFNTLRGKSTSFDKQGYLFNNSLDISYNIDSSEKAIDAYDSLSYVAFCVNIRSEGVSRTPWSIVDSKGNEVLGTKSEALFRKPMQGLNSRQFIKTACMHLDLDGNVFILKEKFDKYAVINDIPSDLMLWNPSQVRVLDQEGKEITARTVTSGKITSKYWLFSDTKYAIVDFNTVEHINIGNPKNLNRGMGIVQSNASLLEGDKIQDIFDRVFFEQAPLTKMIISDPENNVLSSDMPKVKKEIRDEYGKSKNPIMVLEKGLKAEFPDIKYSELEMMARQLFSKENILMMFRVPRSKAGLETRFATRDQELIEWQEVLGTIFTPLEESFTNIVQDIEGRKDVFFKFNRDEIIDFDKALRLASEGVDRGYVTPVQAREITGQEADENASDEYYTTMNRIPVGDLSLSAQGDSTPPKDNGKSLSCGCGNHSEEIIEAKQEGSDQFFQSVHANREKMAAHRQAKRTKSKRMEGIIAKDIDRYYKGMEKRVKLGLQKHFTQLINGKGANMGDIWDDLQEFDEDMKAARKFYTSVVSIGIDDANTLFDTSIDNTTKNTNFRLVVDRLSTRYVQETLNSRKKELVKILDKATKDGLTINEINGEMSKYFDTLTKGADGRYGYRAVRIARTEASNAWDAAAKLSYEDLGVKTFDVVGCEDNETDCNAKNVPMDQWDSLVFHPNHTGTRVPSNLGGEKMVEGGKSMDYESYQKHYEASIKSKAIEYAKDEGIDIKDCVYFQEYGDFKAVAKEDAPTAQSVQIGDSFTIEGYLSTFRNIDREGDIVKDGAFTESVKGNKVFPLLLDHWNNTGSQAGSFKAKEDSKGLFIKGSFIVTEKTIHQARLILGGHLLTMSMGGLFKYLAEKNRNGNMMIEKVVLLEGSIVSIPANAKAVFVVKSLEEKPSVLDDGTQSESKSEEVTEDKVLSNEEKSKAIIQKLKEKGVIKC